MRHREVTEVMRAFFMALIACVMLACSDSEQEPENPEGEAEEGIPEEARCFIENNAWAMGLDHESHHIKFIDLPTYDESMVGKGDILWLYLELDTDGDEHEHIGAVKFKELEPGEIPEGSAAGEYVKLLIRIDEPMWYFGPDTENIKVQGFTSEPSGGFDPSTFDTHSGVAEIATGDDWEYYEVILKRYPYYSVHVGAKMEVECED
ncbi:hypothetical protein [Echinicola rosea]|nr:hypothetical protein [Echinicola rosea]